MAVRAGYQSLGGLVRISGRKRFSDTCLRKLFYAPWPLSDTFAHELDTRRQIRVPEVCRIYLCHSPKAESRLATNTASTITIEGSGRGTPRSAAHLRSRSP